MADGSPKTAPRIDLRLAFDSLYHQHAPMVRGALRQLGVPASNLDDAVQDVFVVLHRRIDDYEHGRSLTNWVWGIARGVASGYRRGERRRRRLHAELPSPELDTPADRGLARHQAGVILDEFLGSLDADKCAVFMLADVEGHTGAEIAAKLDVNINTVYARLRAARRHFSVAMERHRTPSARPLFAAWLPWSMGLGKPALVVSAVAALLVVHPVVSPPPEPVTPPAETVAVAAVPQLETQVIPAVKRTRARRPAPALAPEPELDDDIEVEFVTAEPIRRRGHARSTAVATPPAVEVAAEPEAEVFEVVSPPLAAPWVSRIQVQPRVRHPELVTPRTNFIEDFLALVSRT
ncbi:MAG: sigma-70 family RNA polymerase sigma factor [Myxococcota bacterium]